MSSIRRLIVKAAIGACALAGFASSGAYAASPDGMKLYQFSSYWLDIGKSALSSATSGDEKIMVPVGFYLIRHPKGDILFDTGNNDRLLQDKTYWVPLGALLDNPGQPAWFSSRIVRIVSSRSGRPAKSATTTITGSCVNQLMQFDEKMQLQNVTVQSVEMRDVIIPAALQDAMSREAQAAREKAARVILAQAEVEIANQFDKAAESYRDNPTALHLRAMNMLYEGLKEKGALMLVPSSAVESMGMGGLIGAAALRQQKLAGSEETPE